jgi:hypothetical protein
MSIKLQPVDLRTDDWELSTREATAIEEGETNLEQVLITPIDALTTVDLNGTGAFDVLMKAAKGHIDEEYDAQRIVGKEYSAVYLGVLIKVLQTSVRFLSNEQQVHKINAEIGLIRQKTVTELYITDDNIPVGLGFNHIPEVKAVIPPIDCYAVPLP